MRQARDAFADAIKQAEKSLRRGAKGARAETLQDRGHDVAKLAEERARRRREEARDFAKLARRLGLDDATLAKVDAVAKAHAARPETWIFVMISPEQNAEVVDWLEANSKRPQKALKLWSRLLTHLRVDTGEIMATRQELAERVGMEPRTLSETMTELASINAIRRVKEGRKVRYFLNPHIATHLPTTSARAAAREESGPVLRTVEGGRSDG